ncbi:hypothetical protein Enr10x_45570 [Gimesia panareensis]|uniref:Uncharacterized protein n=1 Tax=Gimesia panareensis TaxID=2527978 RepID=A0A517QC52_9PLAN|nr:hypothetical protein [Gimesia panareensis]QDT29208.1 hypothetical protein Enr10x_45570 [Gimesia panareensis]
MSLIKQEDRGFQPPAGVNFSTEEILSLKNLSGSLCKIASFLQNDLHASQLVRYEDWWQHDGLHFRKAACDIHDLFAIVQNPRSLIEAMPGDELVYIGIAPPDALWYLRFYSSWDDEGLELTGLFDLTLPADMAVQFRDSVIPELECTILEQDALEYFKEIIL